MVVDIITGIQNNKIFKFTTSQCKVTLLMLALTFARPASNFLCLSSWSISWIKEFHGNEGNTQGAPVRLKLCFCKSPQTNFSQCFGSSEIFLRSNCQCNFNMAAKCVCPRPYRIDSLREPIRTKDVNLPANDISCCRNTPALFKTPSFKCIGPEWPIRKRVQAWPFDW